MKRDKKYKPEVHYLVGTSLIVIIGWRWDISGLFRWLWYSSAFSDFGISLSQNSTNNYWKCDMVFIVQGLVSRFFFNLEKKMFSSIKSKVQSKEMWNSCAYENRIVFVSLFHNLVQLQILPWIADLIFH